MNIFKTFFIIFSVIGVISCNPNSKSDENETLALLALAMPQAVNLNFEALANGQPLVTGSNITADSRTVQFRDFRFFISEVKLVKEDGSTVDVALSSDNVWQSNGVALVDLETTQSSEINTKVTGTAPTGTYSGVQFSVGVPETLNHMDSTTQKAPLNISSMYWSWTGGYKHSKIEFTYDSGTNWTSLHIGSTTCNGAPNYGNCSKKFRASIQLNGQINAGNQKVSFDVDKLLNGHTFGAMGMCMPGTAAPCDTLVQAFGLNITSGAVDSSITQRVFSLK